jgi:hypothetical protein
MRQPDAVLRRALKAQITLISAFDLRYCQIRSLVHPVRAICAEGWRLLG